MNPYASVHNTKQLRAILRELIYTKEALRMKQFIQHGQISTYEHCLRVALLSYLINRRLNLGADEASLVRGAFLHDFYLYDWHDPAQHPRLHGFYHPAAALANARKYFSVNKKECNIIESHMWPLTITILPRCREAFIVCLADKWCSTQETLFCRHRP